MIKKPKSGNIRKSKPVQEEPEPDMPAEIKAQPPVAKAPVGIPEAVDGIEEPGDKPKTSSRTLGARRATAVDLAKGQREISVSEFFMKNRHLLGFDSPRKALLTTIKEAVDNSLDACEEAGVLPHIDVTIKGISETRFRVIVQDNGPGIVKNQIGRIFGKLLYGSKFHRLKQSRGQQGIGISAAGMYGMLTTGKSVAITTKPHPAKPAHYCEIQIDSKKNEPQYLKEEDGHEWTGSPTGTRVEIELEAEYKKGKHSVNNYLQQTAIANPHATLSFKGPEGEDMEWTRSSDQLPPEPKEIKPHPRGIELGILIKMMKSTTARNMGGFLKKDFSRVSPAVAAQILAEAKIPATANPKRLAASNAEDVFKAINSEKIRIMAPPTNCISPIGGDLIEKSLRAQINAEFYCALSRPPAVYRGNPFQIEAGIAYGGPDADADSLVKVMRFANRVPLLYQPGGCAITQAIIETDWRNYHMSQSRGSLPAGPAVILVHLASVWVPFTSESKEAVAQYPEIRKEIKLALQECGRALGRFLSGKARVAYEAKRRKIFEIYIDELVEAAGAMARINRANLRKDLVGIAKSKTLDAETPSGGENGSEAEAAAAAGTAAGAKPAAFNGEAKGEADDEGA